MPLIWCSISGHGFGHAAQLLRLLTELCPGVSGLRPILRRTVPPWFFDGRLTMAWEVSPVEQDIGCVQHGPLTIDVDATWAAHQAFHAEWEKRVVQEVSAIRHASPDLVVSNISHLAVEAAAPAGVPAVGLCSLSWDGVLEPLLDRGGPARGARRSEEHTSELQSQSNLVCRLLLDKKNAHDLNRVPRKPHPAKLVTRMTLHWKPHWSADSRQSDILPVPRCSASVSD